MAVEQPLTHPTVKASTSTPTTTPAAAKSKEKPYTKPEIGKCYKCGELDTSPMSAQREDKST